MGTKKQQNEIELSKEEVEILKLIVGDNNQLEMASQLKMDYNRLAQKIYILKKKLNCRTNVGLAVYAIRNEIVEL